MSRLLGADERNDSRQLGTLVELLVLDALVDVLARGDVVADLEHAVLQRQELGERVVEEGCGEGDVGG